MTPPHFCPDSSAIDAPAGTMTLCTHPTIPSDLTPEQALESDTGILHASLLYVPTLTLQYWITIRSILPNFTQDRQDAGYEVLYFTPFSTKAACTHLYPNKPVSNTISARHTDTAPPTFPYLASSMSTSPTPETPPSHNSPSNENVDPTTALIALMQKTLQQTPQ